MRKRIGPLCALFVALALGLGLMNYPPNPARAANNGTVSLVFQQVGVGATASLAIGTQTSCYLRLYGPPSGSSVQGTVQQAPDNVTWSASPNFPAINAAGLYVSTGSVSTSYLRFYNSGNVTINGQILCGPTVPVAENPNWGAYGVPTPAALAATALPTAGYVYTTLQSVPLTVGQSYGPLNLWYVTVTENAVYPNALPTAAAPLYACISSLTTPLPTTVYFDAAPAATPTAGAPCASSAPANALAGGAPFAFATTGGQTAQTLNTSKVQWQGTVPSNSAWTFLCQVEGATATSVTVNGSCAVFAIPI